MYRGLLTCLSQLLLQRHCLSCSQRKVMRRHRPQPERLASTSMMMATTIYLSLEAAETVRS
jgi:hypothetical protein